MRSKLAGLLGVEKSVERSHFNVVSPSP